MNIKKLALSGVIAVTVISSPLAFAGVTSHTVEIDGKVVANTCELFATSDAKVSMNEILLSDVPAKVGDMATVGKKSYKLGLQNCVPGSEGDMTISYTSHPSLPSSILNPGSADGVSFQIVDNADKEVVNGKKIDFTANSSGKYEQDFSLVYQKTDETVTLGTVTGSVTFDFNYL